VAAIIASALDLFIITTPSPPPLQVLKIEMTFCAASLMQIKVVTIYQNAIVERPLFSRANAALAY
jgi:hypothetical protein